MTGQSLPSQFKESDPEAIAKVAVLGIPFAYIRLPELLEYTRSAIDSYHHQGDTHLLAYANAHTCNLFTQDEDFRRSLLAADLIYADGNGPRLAACLSGSSLPPRMTGADWIDDLCRLSEREGFRLYFLGAAPGVAETAASFLIARFPSLCVVGVQDGYFSSEHESSVIRSINEAKTDILVLGMGSPRQEIWMAQQRANLEVPVVWGAGGVFDYASGRIPRPAWWMRKLALEWLGRMLIEPRRLAIRYLAGIPVFMARAIFHGFRHQLQRLALWF